jgi:osmotically-inducible protein OsmY
MGLYKQRRKTMKSDRELQIDVLDELRWEPDVKATDIGATVKDGVVTLVGTVDSYAEKWAAERAMKRLPGVKALAIEIEVEPPGGSQRTDSDIAGAAEHALKWHVLVPDDRIKVTVENGRLTLEGEVDRQFQKSAAERAVLHLTGVKGVTNQITIKPKVAPAKVKEQIEAAFKRNALFDAHQINVQVDGSKVTLSGSVGSWVERDEAEDSAWAAPGVSEVKNDLLISD